VICAGSFIFAGLLGGDFMEENTKKRGRPAKETSRKRQVKLLLTEEEYQILSESARKHSTSQADILRGGMKLELARLQYCTGFDSESDDF
jgi:hypothetical protein